MGKESIKNKVTDIYSGAVSAKDLSRKVKSAKRQRALNGLFISSQAPFGYKPDPGNRNRLVVDENAAEVVKHIFSVPVRL